MHLCRKEYRVINTGLQVSYGKHQGRGFPEENYLPGDMNLEISLFTHLNRVF